MSVQVVLLMPLSRLISLSCFGDITRCISPGLCFSTDKLKFQQELECQVHPWYFPGTPSKVMAHWDIRSFGLNMGKMSLAEEVQVFVVEGNQQINRSSCAGTGHH